MEYLFKKNGEKYTRYTINELVKYLNKHNLDAVIGLCKDLDYPFMSEPWLRYNSPKSLITPQGLMRYFNCMNLPAYRDFCFDDTEHQHKILLNEKTKAEEIKEKLDVVRISREDYNTLVKDRLDFGFDSIYFRYSEAIEELSYYKEKEAHKECTHFDRKHWANGCKMHFYNALEQLLQAHVQEEKK